MGKLDTRLELRIDKPTYEQLERRAAAERVSVAEVVRKAIRRELASDDRSWRIEAVERAIALDVPVPDDPAVLSQELDAAYDTHHGHLSRTMYVDTAIFMYAMGTESRFKDPCSRILRAGSAGAAVLVTSAETLREVLHRYGSIGRDEAVQPAFEAVSAAVQRVLPVTAEDLEEARRLADRVRPHHVSARDLVHAAVARRQGLREILTVDAGFAHIPGVVVVDPLTWSVPG